METWPISIAREGSRVFIGIPARLGRPHSTPAVENAHLEEQVGEEWLVELLLCLMPQDRAWAWWTGSEAFTQTKLSYGEAPSRVVPSSIDQVLRHNVALRHMTLSLIPAGSEAQEQVLDRTGLDSEHVPDHLWTAPDRDDVWELEEIVSWCRHPKDWKSTSATAAQKAERIVTVFGDYVFCMVSQEAAEPLQQALTELAESWGLTVVEGKPEHAWHSARATPS